MTLNIITIHITASLHNIGALESNAKEDNTFTAPKPATRDYVMPHTTSTLNRHNSYKETKSTTDLCKFLIAICICAVIYRYYQIKVIVNFFRQPQEIIYGKVAVKCRWDHRLWAPDRFPLQGPLPKTQGIVLLKFNPSFGILEILELIISNKSHLTFNTHLYFKKNNLNV